MPILKCQPLWFYSVLDEDLFFVGLRKISAVRKIEGRSDGLHVTVHSKPSQKALRELLGLFCRFDLEMNQFAQFATEENQGWFRRPTAFWYRQVFESKKRPNKAPEPTTMAVTPRAPSSTSRTSHGRGSS